MYSSHVIFAFTKNSLFATVEVSFGNWISMASVARLISWAYALCVYVSKSNPQAVYLQAGNEKADSV